MLRLNTPHYPNVNLIDVDHFEEPALREVLREMRDKPDANYKLYRADIYNDNIFGAQPVFTVEMIYLPEQNRFGVEWVDGMEWIECDSVKKAIDTWLDHHVDEDKY